MRFPIFFIILFVSQLSYGKNNRDFLIGFNYPVPSYGEIPREFGLDIGYQYSYNFKNKYFITSGIRLGVYEMLNWKGYGIDLYIPLRFGYTINNAKISCGISFNSAQFMTFIRYSGMDPELNSNTSNTSPSQNNDIIYTMRTFGLGLNSHAEYQITKRFQFFIDYLIIGLNDRFQDNKKYKYGLLTAGLNIRLNL